MLTPNKVSRVFRYFPLNQTPPVDPPEISTGLTGGNQVRNRSRGVEPRGNRPDRGPFVCHGPRVGSERTPRETTLDARQRDVGWGSLEGASRTVGGLVTSTDDECVGVDYTGKITTPERKREKTENGSGKRGRKGNRRRHPGYVMRTTLFLSIKYFGRSV